MKKLIATLCFGLLALASFSQSATDTIAKAKSLIAKQQYLSAYYTLYSYPKEDADIINAFTDLVLDHHYSTNEYMDKWRMENKKPDGKNEMEIVDMPLDKVLTYFVEKYPNNCQVKASLSKLYAYFIKVNDLYSELETLKSINDYTEKEINSNCADYRSNYITGYCNLYLGNPQKAITLLQKSITANPNFAPGYLQLGKAYLQTKDYSNALKNGKRSMELESKQAYRANAALLVAQAYEASNDNSNALKYYETADTLLRRDFFILKSMLNFYVKTNNNKAQETLATFIGSQGRTSPHSYVDALDIYSANNKMMDLAKYCQKSLADFSYNNDALAVINFTLGFIYKDINKDMAKDYFKKAKELGLVPTKSKNTRNHPHTVKMLEEAAKWAS